MKNQLIKIYFVIIFILLFVACSNSNNENAKKSSSQLKESFSENVMVRLFNNYLSWNFPNDKEYYSKNEYETIDELMNDAFDNWESLKKGEFEPERFEKIKKTIEEAEKISKSKFFLQRDEYGVPQWIYFTPKENSDEMYGIFTGMAILHLATQIDKISVKEYVNERGLWILHEEMKEGVDIKSLGLDPATTEKLLEAQNYKGN